MASRVTAAFAAFVVTCLALILAASDRASAEQRLQNGGFDGGTAGWNGIGLAATGCQPRSGSGALGVTSVGGADIFAQQTVLGPFGAGTHTFSGFYRVATGGPTSITVSITWNTSQGQVPRSQNFSSSAAYTPFSLVDSNPPTSAISAIVRVTASTLNATVLCLDDLVFDAPPAPTPTPFHTPTSTATPTPQPSPTSTAVPASTSVPAAATATTAASGSSNPATTPTPTAVGAATATRTPTLAPGQTATASTATPAAAATVQAPPPGFAFVNGGFEEELRGWQRYGGDLVRIGGAGRGGSGAGLLSSNTNSTKWAFQVVAIDPAKAYEFNGYLKPGVGVRSAYLRISWYDAADGSGRAISTDDSGAKLSAASDGYTYLSTGGIAPPAGARSARLRVMLTPEGSNNAIVHLDDFAFFETTAAVRPASQTSAPDEPIETAVATATPVIATPAPGSTAAAIATASSRDETPAAGEATRVPRTTNAPSGQTNARPTTPPSRAAPFADVRGTRSDNPADSKGKPLKHEGAPGSPTPQLLPGEGNTTMHVAIGLIAFALAAYGAYITSKRQA